MPGGAVNNPPDLTNPVGSQTWTQTFSPTGLPSFQCTVTAGELVQFDVIGQDLDLYNGVTPQEITMEISGGQMASDYVTTTACLNPPCATFMDSNGVIPPLISPTTVGGTFSGKLLVIMCHLILHVVEFQIYICFLLRCLMIFVQLLLLYSYTYDLR